MEVVKEGDKFLTQDKKKTITQGGGKWLTLFVFICE
jgi:hypothetical protein